MKTLMLAAIAAAMSISALPAMSVPSKAASLVITTDNDNMRHDDRYWRHHHRDRDRWRDGDHWRDRDRWHDRRCRIQIEKRWHHGRPVIREVKVCRGNDW